MAMLIDAEFNATTHRILSAAIEVHRNLGPGLLESTYTRCLLYELRARHLRVEVKSVLATHEVHKAQALTYMKFTNCPAGLVINFNVPRLMDGVNRLVLEDRLGDRADSGI